MQVEWYGQSAFRLTASGTTVFVDPFADLSGLAARGRPTIGAEQAAAVTERLDPRWVVPMHYRTARIDFLETVEPFLERISHVQRLDAARFDIAELPGGKRPLAVVPAAP